MKHLLCRGLVFILIFSQSCNTPVKNREIVISERTDSLPSLLQENHSDLIGSRMRLDAKLKFDELQLPSDPGEWENYRDKLRAEIIKKAGVVTDHDLPLNIKETGTIQMKGYSIKNISFQTRPGIYATANLYIPEGDGPFPGVVNMLGHWRKGKIDSEGPQAVGHSLALNKYVCITIDPWGAGERTTAHGDFEYHGSNLGASLMNIGETLLGIQISDNMRAVDLLCSLGDVDPAKIGATGASGGGNQTMWLAAVDERVKASVPVVSVGTFESYVMESNCICELLPDGLTFTEEAGVLALANAVMLVNHTGDTNPTFFPAEMLRTYNNARKVFKMMGKENNIDYRLFDLPHGYMSEDREAMLGWFDLHLKAQGTEEPKKGIRFDQLQEEKLMVFPAGGRDKNIISTDEYCRMRGKELRTAFLNSKTFSPELKKKELRAILRIDEKPYLKKVYHFSGKNGWDRLALETSGDMLIPVLHLAPVNKSEGYVIICDTEGKKGISLSLIDDLRKKGSGVVIIDLPGTGELTSTSSILYDNTGKLHTLSRAELWLGKTILGEWVKTLNIVTMFLRSEYKAEKINIDGTKEAGLAGLFLGATEGNVGNIVLREAPVSYLFDNRESVDFFSMGIHLPGFLNWGDVSLVAALSGSAVNFVDPVSMSGRKEERFEDIQAEFENVRLKCGTRGKIVFFNSQSFTY